MAPHGPRLPSSFTNNRSRSPSPDRFTPHPSPHPDHYESAKPHFTYNNHSTTTDDSSFSEVEFEHDNPAQPSAKALGKRRQVAEEDADSRDGAEGAAKQDVDRIQTSDPRAGSSIVTYATRHGEEPGSAWDRDEG